MKKELITRLHKSFEDYVQSEDGVEFWFARDLQTLLGYAKWDKFSAVIDRAIQSCENAGNEAGDHFLRTGKMVELGSGSKREIDDFKLTRYACYLLAQNGDPSKNEIAFAQAYFAIQTRKAEIVEERLSELRRLDARENLTLTEKRLAGIAFERGIDSAGFARIKSRGDNVLFGGLSTKRMKQKLNASKTRSLADFLPTVTIAAKTFANELTEQNVLQKDLRGESPISDEHAASNKAVRSAMLKRGVKPEALPPAEDIKRVQSRVKAEGKKLQKQSKGLKGK